MAGQLHLHKLPIDAPVLVTLQRAGKIVPSRFHAGGRVHFRLLDGRDLYTDLALAERINKMGVRPMQPFYICAVPRGRRARGFALWLSGEERPVAA